MFFFEVVVQIRKRVGPTYLPTTVIALMTDDGPMVIRIAATSGQTDLPCYLVAAHIFEIVGWQCFCCLDPFIFLSRSADVSFSMLMSDSPIYHQPLRGIIFLLVSSRFAASYLY